MIKLFIITPDQFLNDALARSLEMEDDLTVIGTISAEEPDLPDDVEQADIVLLHAGTTHNTLQLIEDIHALLPDARVVIIHAPDFPDLLLPYLQAGAVGYVQRSDPFGHLLSVIRTVNAGGAVVEPELTRILIDQMVRLSKSLTGPSLLTKTDPELTEREFEVLEAVADGLTNAAIAERLYIEPGTVKNHVHNILDKLEVDNRGQAALWYEQWRQHQELVATSADVPALAASTNRRKIFRQMGSEAHEHGVVFALSEIDEVRSSLKRALQVQCERLGWPVGHIYVLDENAYALISSRIWYTNPEDGFSAFRQATEALQLPIDTGVPRALTDQLEPVWIPEIQEEPNFIRKPAAIADGLRSGLFIPLRLEQTPYGLLEFFSADRFDPADVDAATLEDVVDASARIGELLQEEKSATNATESST